MPEPRRLTRREAIRKGAVVGGHVLWIAPAIQTIAPRAFAQGVPSPAFTCCECRNGQAGSERCTGLDHVECLGPLDLQSCIAACAAIGKGYCFHQAPTPLNCVDATPGGSPNPRSICSG